MKTGLLISNQRNIHKENSGSEEIPIGPNYMAKV